MSNENISSLNVRMTNAEQNIEKVFKRLSFLEKFAWFCSGVVFTNTPFLLKLIGL